MSESEQKVKQVWHKPELRVYGKITDVTQDDWDNPFLDDSTLDCFPGS